MLTVEEMQKRIDTPALSMMDFIQRIINDSTGAEMRTIRKFDPVAYKVYFDRVYNIPVSFDIETTADPETKTAYMYHWQCNFNGWTVCGRTWEEWYYLLDVIHHVYETNEHKRIIIYIHNYSYEFSFMGPREHIIKMFSTDERKPLYVINSMGIEYRDSYILSGCSLAAVGKGLTNLHIQKMSGDLDYSIKRNSQTVLTDKEAVYCWNDVKVLTAYIYEQIQQYHGIDKIPLTNTGRVREYIREKCLKDDKKKRHVNTDYIAMMQNLTLEPEEYEALKAAYQGGYTHAGHMHAGRTCRHVYSVDFTSSYPAVECADYMPVTSGERMHYKSSEEYLKDCRRYCVVALVQFRNLKEVFKYEHYITSYKALKGSAVNMQEDNGRVISADALTMWVTEIDMRIICKNYSADITVLDAYRYTRGNLPREIVESVLNMYADKTTLKDVEGRESEYKLKKGMLNSNYGMMVTDITNPEITYNAELEKPWNTIAADYDAQIDKYNDSKRRFLYYAWGIYITAHARERLWAGIFEMGPDYIYSDTDSIKFTNMARHRPWLERYNWTVQKEIEHTCIKYGIDPEKARPRTTAGDVKPLGVWDYEGYYDKFKTLGAKRYIIEGVHRPNGSIKAPYMITIAGLNKKTGAAYIFSKKNPFLFFNDGMKIPAENSGRTVSYYTDKPVQAYIEDAQGHGEIMKESACVYIENSEYNMSMVDAYARYLENGIKENANIEKVVKGKYEKK